MIGALTAPTSVRTRLASVSSLACLNATRTAALAGLLPRIHGSTGGGSRARRGGGWSEPGKAEGARERGRRARARLRALARGCRPARTRQRQTPPTPLMPCCAPPFRLPTLTLAIVRACLPIDAAPGLLSRVLMPDRPKCDKKKKERARSRTHPRVFAEQHHTDERAVTFAACMMRLETGGG